LNKQDIIIWAPQDTSAMLGIIAGYRRLLTHTTLQVPDINLTVLIPYDALPGCTDSQHIVDLLWHVCLDKKWKSFRKATQIINDPIRCIFSGPSGPIYQTKSILAVTFAPPGNFVPELCLPWRDPIVRMGSGNFLIIDVTDEQTIPLHNALLDISLPGIIHWEGPLRSPASRADCPRNSFRGHLSPDVSSTLAIQTLICTLRNDPSLTQCYVGSSLTYVAALAKVADFGHSNALIPFLDMCQEIVMVSPTRALILTMASEANWAIKVTEFFRQSPAQAISRICWRTTANENKLWVKPLELDSQIKAAKTRARHEQGLPTSEGDPIASALIILRGPLGANPEGLLQQIMHALSTKCPFPLTQANNTHNLPSGHWAPVRNSDQEWIGNIRLQLSSFQEVQLVHTIVSNSIVILHGQSLLLDLYNSYLNSPQESSTPGNA